MINLSTFTSLRVDAEHLRRFAGTSMTVCIIGILRELRNVDYNQECIVELYNGFLVNIVDGPVHTDFPVFTYTETSRMHLVCWLFNVGHGDEGRREHSRSVSSSGNVLLCMTVCDIDVYCKIPNVKEGLATFVEILRKVIDESIISFLTCVDLGSKVGM
jgi:hypothetical protein